MKILFLGFGVEPRMGGGAALIQATMIQELSAAGHCVDLLETGNYSILGGSPSLTKERRGERTIYRLWNSRNWPGNPDVRLHQLLFREDKLIVQAYKESKPDIVHIHELTYLASSTVHALLDCGARVVRTIHNYLDVCSQRDLLPLASESCNDFDAGRRCVTCRGGFYIPPVQVRLSRLSNVMRIPRYFRLFVQGAVRKSAARESSLSLPAARENVAGELYRDRRAEYIRALNSCHVVHCYSHYSSSVLERYGVARGKIRYIPVSTRAIDALFRHPPRKRSGEKIQFQYRGGIAYNKGVDVLVRAFKRVAGPNTELKIYGSGGKEYEDQIKALANGYPVKFMGSYVQCQLDDLNAEADIGVVPSRAHELFGLVGIEYLNGGRPVIASLHGGCADYVKHNENGLLIENGSEEALAAALQRVLSNPSDITRMQANIRRWTSCNSMLNQLVDIYKEALNVSRK